MFRSKVCDVPLEALFRKGKVDTHDQKHSYLIFHEIEPRNNVDPENEI